LSNDRLYAVVEERKVNKGKKKDALDDALGREDEDLAQEAKRLRLQEIVENRRKSLAKVKGEDGSEQGTRSAAPSNLTVEEAKEISKMPEDERAQGASLLQTFRTTTPQKGVDPMLYMLMGFARNNPQASQTDFVEYAKVNSDLIKTGMELSKASRPSGGDGSGGTNQAVQFLNTMKEMFVQGIRDPMIQAIKENRPAPSVFETILLDDNLHKRAQDMGIFSKPPIATGLSGIEQATLKKMDMEMEVEKTRREEIKDERKRSFELEEKKLAVEERRTNAFIGFGERMVQGVVKEFTVEEGGGEGGRQPQGGGVVQPKVEGDFEVKNCPACGAPIPVNLKEKPKQVKCEGCGSVIKVNY